jgi:hypothetical protein
LSKRHTVKESHKEKLKRKIEPNQKKSPPKKDMRDSYNTDFKKEGRY